MYHVSNLSKQHLKNREYAMSKNNYKELDKIVLDGWVNKALDQELSK
jgi:hypothetical protein